MRFGIFYEHQLPRPWPEGGELKLFQDALSQVERGQPRSTWGPTAASSGERASRRARGA
jgi:hypothetical protein